MVTVSNFFKTYENMKIYHSCMIFKKWDGLTRLKNFFIKKKKKIILAKIIDKKKSLNDIFVDISMYKKKKSTLLTQTRKPVKVELFFNIEENFKVWTIWKKQKKTQSTNNTIFNKLALNFRGKINKFYVYKYFIHVFRSFSRERENFVFLKNLGKIKKQKAYFIGYHEKIIKFKNFLPPKKKKTWMGKR